MGIVSSSLQNTLGMLTKLTEPQLSCVYNVEQVLVLLLTRSGDAKNSDTLFRHVVDLQAAMARP